jgi:hypothetical protein
VQRKQDVREKARVVRYLSTTCFWSERQKWAAGTQRFVPHPPVVNPHFGVPAAKALASRSHGGRGWCEAQVGYSRATIREIARTAKVIAHSVAVGVRHLVSDRQFQPHSPCKH